MTESNDDRLARLGETAALLQRDGLFMTLMDEAEASYMRALLDCDERDDMGRFRFAQAVKVCRAVRAQINVMVETGKVSARINQDIHKRKRIFGI